MNDSTTAASTGPPVADVIAMSCAHCDARTTVAVSDPFKALVVRIFREAHTGHQPTVAFGRQLPV